MADYIDRQRLIDDFHTAGSCFVYGNYIPAIVSRIKMQPTVDLKTLLIGRCKDCANWYKQHCASGPCATEPTDADFFCGNFEPKTQLKELATLQPLEGVGTKEGAGKNHVPGAAPERSNQNG